MKKIIKQFIKKCESPQERGGITERRKKKHKKLLKMCILENLKNVSKYAKMLKMVRAIGVGGTVVSTPQLF